MYSTHNSVKNNGSGWPGRGINQDVSGMNKISAGMKSALEG